MVALRIFFFCYQENFTTSTTTTELVDDVMQTLDTYGEVDQTTVGQHNLQVQQYAAGTLDESMIAASLQPDLTGGQGDVSRVEYFAVPPNTTQLPVQVCFNLFLYVSVIDMK